MDGRERPSVEMTARLAEMLALDAEQLRALSGRLTDDELAYLRGNPRILALIGAMMEAGFGERETEKLVRQVERQAKG